MMKKENYIYIGPSIPQLGLKQNTLYRSEQPPEALAKLAREKGVVRSLYIKTSELAKAQQQLTRRGSVEHSAIETMHEFAKKVPR
jgi:hypothetical protein